MVEKFIPRKAVVDAACAAYPTPFHLYNASMIKARAKKLNAAFSWNKGFREYFAVKALPNPEILKILQAEGCGVDCSSMAELQMSERCGFSGDMIMFSSNETPAEEYEYARKLGAIINLDDITHIDFLAQHGGIPEDVCLRYNPGGKLSSGTMIMGDPGDNKYGMTKAQIFEAAAKLKTMGAKRFGLHALLASNSTDKEYYSINARLLFDLAKEVSETVDMPCFMVNLSGGVGIPYKPEDASIDIDYVGESVRAVYEEVFTANGIQDVHVASELGRWMTGPCGVLVTTVLHKKHIYKEYIGLDACAANLMRPAMYNAYHHVIVSGKEDVPCTELVDVVGSLCENNDKFAIDRMLPPIDIGDHVVILDTGAHGHSMGYNYNGKLRSAEILLEEDGSFRMIRRAETTQDYFATLDILDYMK